MVCHADKNRNISSTDRLVQFRKEMSRFVMIFRVIDAVTVKDHEIIIYILHFVCIGLVMSQNVCAGR